VGEGQKITGKLKCWSGKKGRGGKEPWVTAGKSYRFTEDPFRWKGRVFKQMGKVQEKNGVHPKLGPPVIAILILRHCKIKCIHKKKRKKNENLGTSGERTGKGQGKGIRISLVYQRKLVISVGENAQPCDRIIFIWRV